MRARTAVSLRPSWRRFDIDAGAIAFSPRLVPYSTIMAINREGNFVFADETFLRKQRLKRMVPDGTKNVGGRMRKKLYSFQEVAARIACERIEYAISSFVCN